MIAAGWARDAGIPVIADLDDLYPGVEDAVGKIDYLITSRDIPGRLTGDHELAQVAARSPQPLRLPPYRRNPGP